MNPFEYPYVPEGLFTVEFSSIGCLLNSTLKKSYDFVNNSGFSYCYGGSNIWLFLKINIFICLLFLNIYLSIYLAACDLSWSMQGLPCIMQDLFAVHRLWLWYMGSVAAVCGLSCSAACGSLVPWPGIEPASPALQGGFLINGPPGRHNKLNCVHTKQYIWRKKVMKQK